MGATASYVVSTTSDLLDWPAGPSDGQVLAWHAATGSYQWLALSFLAPTGNGSGLTGLNASALASGTVPASRLPASGVVAGSYPFATVAVDTFGRVTSIQSASIPPGMLKGSAGALASASAGVDYLAPAGNGSQLTGITSNQVNGLGSAATRAASDFLPSASAVPISGGGTGQATASAALAALLPAQSGQGGKVLGTDGSGAAWVAQSAGGGSAAAGGSTGEVQVNSGGSLAGTSAILVTSGQVVVGGSSPSNDVPLTVSGTSNFGAVACDNPNSSGSLRTGFLLTNRGYVQWFLCNDYRSNGTNDFFIYDSNLRFYVGAGNGRVAIGGANASPQAQLHVTANDGGAPVEVVQATSGQSANLTEWRDASGSLIGAVSANGARVLAPMADSAAPARGLYWSSTAGKAAIKDDSGTIHYLW